MDVYAVDDLLNLPSDEFFSSSASDFLHHPSSSAAAAAAYNFDQSSVTGGYSAADFVDILSVPSREEAAELEWVSTYMDDSFTDFPARDLTAGAGFHGRARSKRSRPSIPINGVSVKKEEEDTSNYVVRNGGADNSKGDVARRCTHCASEKTPQWRTGPLGPKTLCNACGVRFKSGRLVPEYRPAASPTFVLTQHSNSHRKVLELRRQKEMLLQQQQQQQQAYGRHYRVC